MKDRKSLFRKAKILAYITILYNVVEGVFSTYFGAEDQTIALFGFGIDSFVEAISGLGIYMMLKRAERKGLNTTGEYEKWGLKITGLAFYILSGGLLIGIFLNLYMKKRPETALPGVIISTVSIATMWALLKAKLRVGQRLGSDAIIMDAYCTRACLYLSFVILLSSAAYELSGVRYIDSIGALAVSYHAWVEGKEAFEKARAYTAKTL